jgi:uncharacterized SAM-binding protein YcdF (DUF218 family)
MKRRLPRIPLWLKQVVFIVFLVWLWQALFIGMAVTAFGVVDHAQPADVIVVLGAGLRRDSKPGPALIRRSAHGADLWKRGLAPYIVCTGGRPSLTLRSESEVCAELLQDNGVPASAILVEDRSRSTEENAQYTKELMDARGWHTAVLASDAFHLFRARWIFQQAGVTVYTSPADVLPPAGELLVYTGREVAALHWLVIKSVFNLPITYVQGI